MTHVEIVVDPDIYDNAAARVEESWNQGSYYYKGAVCAVGAIRLALGAIPVDDSACPLGEQYTDTREPCQSYVASLEEYLEALHGYPIKVIDYNDYNNMTADKVATVLRSHATYLRRQREEGNPHADNDTT